MENEDMALDGNKRISKTKQGLHIDNGKPFVSKETQEVKGQFSSDWEMINIPVTDEVNVSSLLPKEADGAVIFTYDGASKSWQRTRVHYVNGEMIQDSELTIKPLQGFWIKSPNEFNISTYVPTTVSTGETPPAVPTSN